MIFEAKIHAKNKFISIFYTMDYVHRYPYLIPDGIMIFVGFLIQLNLVQISATDYFLFFVGDVDCFVVSSCDGLFLGVGFEVNFLLIFKFPLFEFIYDHAVVGQDVTILATNCGSGHSIFEETIFS